MATPTRAARDTRPMWGQAAILAGFLLAVVVMHGVPSSPTDVMGASPPTTHASHAGDPVPTDDDSGHHEGMLHVCLAVLFVAALLTLAWGASRRDSGIRLADPQTPRLQHDPPPARLSRAELHLLRC